MNLNITEIKKRVFPDAALAITLESDKFSAVLVSGETGERDLFSVPMGSDAVASDPEKAGKELAAGLATAGVRQKRCVVCLPPGWALTSSTELPEMQPEDLRDFLELRAEREFPISGDEMRVAHSPYSLPDGKRRTTLAAVPLKRMEAIHTMLAAAGCRAVSISLALDECLAEPKAALHFLANGTHTSVIVTAGGGVVSMRSLASPGPLPETPFDAGAFYREVRITLGRLPEPIRQQVREAYFGGSPASAKRLCDATADQLLQLGIESVGPGGADGSAVASHGESAVKAAQCFLRKQPVAFEFVVPEVKQWEVMLKKADLQGRKRLITIVAGVIAALLLTVFVRGQIEGYYTRRWDKMKNNVADLTELQNKIRTYQPWFPGAPVTLQMVDSLISVFPEKGDVWAKSIEMKDNGQIVITAFARSRAAELALSDRLIAMPGVTGVGTENERGTNPIEFTILFNYKTRP